MKVGHGPNPRATRKSMRRRARLANCNLTSVCVTVPIVYGFLDRKTNTFKLYVKSTKFAPLSPGKGGSNV